MINELKTNMVVKSEDRSLFGVKVRQETKTSFLNLSDLQDAYDSVRVQKGWNLRRIDSVTAKDQFKERVYYVLLEQGFIKTTFVGFMELTEKEGITKILKDAEAWKTTGRGNNKTTWCDPYIWVLIAMEMNPELYAKVVMWLTDSLIINRIEAGNFCKALNASVCKFNIDGLQYMTLAKALNHIVFGKHETGIRNTATKEQLKELTNLESKMAFAIDMGYVTSFDMLLSELRKMYTAKTKQTLALLNK